MHAVIVGTKNPAHLEGNLKAVRDGTLPDDMYEEAKERLSQAGEKPSVGRGGACLVLGPHARLT
jgi:aryl-alcohol dehydrogenase-like predicted oxidoreductase